MVKSAWGALPGLLLARFPRPLAEPVLSACDTAEAADGPALAHALVAGGIPAVVGMRRLVDLTDANRFCAALYPEVLAAIKTAVAADGPPGARTIDCRPE